MNLVKYNEQAATEETPKGSIQTLEQFNRLLNEPPDPKEIKINAAAGNSKYLPISYVQTLLDEIFVGLWETKNFTYTVVVNEIVGNVTLRYYHPFAKVWIEREGAASVMIMQKSGSQITDIGSKIKNTLQKDHPHLLASCIVNAARTIGKRFGRDLNRKEVDEYETFYTDIAQAESATNAIDWNSVNDMESLKDLWNSHADLHSNKNFVKTFAYHKRRLTAAA